MQIFKPVNTVLINIFINYGLTIVHRSEWSEIKQNWTVKVNINQRVESAQGRKRMT